MPPSREIAQSKPGLVRDANDDIAGGHRGELFHRLCRFRQMLQDLQAENDIGRGLYFVDAAVLEARGGKSASRFCQRRAVDVVTLIFEIDARMRPQELIGIAVGTADLDNPPLPRRKEGVRRRRKEPSQKILVQRIPIFVFRPLGHVEAPISLQREMNLQGGNTLFH
jgi:hypothetical protein